MFIETSAIVEVLVGGPHSDALLESADLAATGFLVSPTVEFEATSALATRLRLPVESARDQVRKFVDQLQAGRMTITPEIGEIAIAAMARYGKGRGHPAQLNFGDCFSYACAKAAGVPLLYVGDDFSKTDLA